jgi:hypothetical protein
MAAWFSIVTDSPEKIDLWLDFPHWTASMRRFRFSITHISTLFYEHRSAAGWRPFGQGKAAGTGVGAVAVVTQGRWLNSYDSLAKETAE